MKLKFNSVNDVQDFCKIASKIDVDVDVRSFDRRHTVDGKSIVGMMSLDLSQPVNVELYSDDDRIRDQFIMNCKYWIIKNEEELN